MQVVDVNGNIFGNGLEITGPDGKPKTSGGGGSPTGPAGGDLSGSYPNPGVVWGNGLPTYDLQYYSITNPSGFITSATAAATYQPLLTLTTTGSSGPATLTGSTLNIPQYGGGLTVGTTPITSGTVGRILFEGTGNVLQQSANLFWNNTNSRLGIGTASPSATLHSVGSITASAGTARGNFMQPTLVASANNDVMVGLDISPTFTNGAFTGVQNVDLRTKNSGVVIGTGYGYGALYGYANDGILQIKDEGTSSLSGGTYATQIWLRPAGNAAGGNSNYWSTIEHSFGGLFINSGRYTSNLTLKAGRSGVNGNIYFNNAGSTMGMFFGGTGNFGLNTTTDAGYKLDINGTSVFRGTLGLISTTAIQLAVTTNGNTRILSTNNDIILNAYSSTIEHSFGTYSIRKRMLTIYGDANANAGVSIGVNAVNVASAILSAESTTKGFLPPRMTNAQMLAIAAPAAGLVVYDTTNNKHCGYDGTTWQNFY